MRSRTKLRVWLIVLLPTLGIGWTNAEAKIIYVDTNAALDGDGTSWPTAHKYLQDGLDIAVSTDQIWIAAGTYYPTSDYGLAIGDRGKHFRMINGVAIYGGFPPGGDMFANRDPNQYETILSGDLLGNDNPDTPVEDLYDDPCRLDNCYHIFYHIGTNLYTTAILDGFTITGGNANGDYLHLFGGGMLNYDYNSPTLINCKFYRNSAKEAGGMFNKKSNPTITDCYFIENSSIDEGGEGGGMFNNNSSPTVTNCTFISNRAGVGGGMRNYGSYNKAKVISCTFNGNSAFYGGGGMYNDDSSPTVTNCIFTDNSAHEGGGMSNHRGDPNVTNCKFSGNSGSYGGGMRNLSCNATFSSCTFSSNSANYGGGILNRSSSPTILNCMFTDNWARYYGGGIHNWHSTPHIINCILSSNSADYWGGGMFNYEGSNPTVINCVFIDNSAEHGGGMYNHDNENNNPIVTNCTFTHNSALGNPGYPPIYPPYPGLGDSIYSDSNSIVTNCIIWENGDSEIYGPLITVNYSCIQGGWPGEGNINADPAFADPDGPDNIVGTQDDNLRLLAGSPCIDAGDPNYATSQGDVDKDGNLRVEDGDGDGIARIDMGPYEFQKYCGGTGTAEDPYLICAPLHMQQIGANHNDWDKYFKLMDDIDLSAYTGTQFNIIGRYADSTNDEPFTGVFDGNGHTISNLTYTSAGADYVGLFGYVAGEAAAIKDLGLISPDINCAAGTSISALAGCIAEGTIIDCYVEGGTITGNKMVGPLAGRTGEATILRCFATSDVMGSGWGSGGLIWGSGGLIGDASQTTISACYATGSITANNWDVGGLVGHQYEGEILTSYATGTITATGNGVGGLVGNGESMSIVHCYAAGSVRGVDDVGGLVGRYYHGDIIASFWDTLASGQADGIGYDEQTGIVELYRRTTARMRQRATFTDYGWDFAGKTANGTEDVWTIWEGAYYPKLAWENPLAGDFAIDGAWMYQNLPGATSSSLTASVFVTEDPLGNSSYTYDWGFVLPHDVTMALTTTDGGGSADPSCIFAAPNCNEPGGLSDSGQHLTIIVTVTGDDHGNTGTAQAEFGIALLGDVNNDCVVNVADRSIINAFWRLGAAGSFTFKDCDLNCDGTINVVDRSIANAIWRAVLGRNRVTQPCPLR